MFGTTSDDSVYNNFFSVKKKIKVLECTFMSAFSRKVPELQ